MTNWATIISGRTVLHGVGHTKCWQRYLAYWFDGLFDYTCGKFKDAARNSDYIVSKGGMITE
jgi:hypothetical protein